MQTHIDAVIVLAGLAFAAVCLLCGPAGGAADGASDFDDEED